MKHLIYFCKNWLGDLDFRYCIPETKDKTDATCAFCYKKCKLPNMGRQALTRHAGGDKREKF